MAAGWLQGKLGDRSLTATIPSTERERVVGGSTVAVEGNFWLRSRVGISFYPVPSARYRIKCVRIGVGDSFPPSEQEAVSFIANNVKSHMSSS
jgi:hypothetical protein